MPKKPNRTDMQEYVPAGNGDASGEYADEGGSNTHFTNFKKPDDPLPGQTLPKSEPKSEPKLEETPIEEPKKPEMYFRIQGNKIKISFSNQSWDGKKYSTKEELDNQSKQNFEKAYKKVSKKNSKLMNDFAKRTGYKGAIGISDLKEEQAKEVLNITETLFNDFPKLKETLYGIGSKQGLIDVAKYNVYKETDGFKSIDQLKQYKNRDFYNDYDLLEIDLHHSLNQQPFISSTRVSTGNNTIAYFARKPYAETGSIVIKPKSFKRQNKGINEKGSRWTISDEPKGIVAHELGHAVAAISGPTKFNLERVKFWDDIESNYDIAKEISQYAATNRDELIAECFSSHYMGENNELAEKVYNFVKKEYINRWENNNV